MSESMANQAFAHQGRKVTDYEGHDRLQNGVIPRGDARIYVAGWTKDWGSNSSASGYFTDKATIDSCMHDGKLNTNELDEKLQTKLSDYNRASQGVVQAHSDVSAYDVDYKRLDELKTTDSKLYNALTSPDGKKSNEIKVAFGEVSANPQHGQGGGHQYFINPETFKQAVEAKVFKYNPNESFSVSPNPNMKSIERKDITAREYDKLQEVREPKALRTHRNIRNELRHERERLKIDKQDQNDRYQVTNNLDTYIAKPDSAYGYKDASKEKIKNDKTIRDAQRMKNHAQNKAHVR